MTLAQPIWLVLAIPLAAALWYWRLPGRGLQVLRTVMVALVVLAMCAPAVWLPSRAGTVAVVVDRSASMPADAQRRQAEAVALVDANRGGRDRLAVVSFGRNTAVDLLPRGGRFQAFTGRVDPDGSNLAEALETALGLVPRETPGRLLVLSDGRCTGGDPLRVASRAAAREAAVDYRLLARPAADDLAILRVDAPTTVSPGEGFMITAWVRAPRPQTVRYDLEADRGGVAAGQRRLERGVARLTFRDRAPASGTRAYVLRVRGEGGDPVPENNRARLLVGARGPKPTLVVTPSEASGLARLLSAGGMDVVPRRPEACRWNLERLSDYAAVLIENTPAEAIGHAGMTTLAAWVRETGAGLMMTGGEHAYGPGGYFRSPLEPVMPVSMELRREHRKLALAIVVALDRSGSMAMTVPGGRTKMDLANLASAEVVTLLSEMDEFGCVAVDSSAHVVAPLKPVTDPAALEDRIRRIEAMGGGIFVYEALSTASRMLLSATAGTRHIILFADAADSEQPGGYKALLEKCREAGITVSVIGLGTEADTDADLLRDIAERGEGRCLFTQRPEELPRLFAQDTFVVARSTFIKEPTPVEATGGIVTLAGRRFPDLPPVGGYNLCYLRPEANLASVTRDEYEAPHVAAWHAGTGRVLCYTGEADGAYAGPLARWARAGDFFTSLARWTAGRTGDLPDGMLLTEEVGAGRCRITLHLDPEREALPFAARPRVSTLSGRGAGEPRSRRERMQWVSPDTLRVDVPLGGQETALSAVEIPGVGPFTLPPVCLPYSAEYTPARPGEGAAVLKRLAQVTGGTERVSLPEIWSALPARPRRVALGPWLLIAAMALLLAEVLERRTGILSAGALAGLGRVRRRKAAAEPAEAGRPGRRKRPRRRRRRAPAEAAAPEGPAEAPAAGEGPAEAPPARPEAMGESLREARRRARDRTGEGRQGDVD